jgi:hypothetical protein
MGSINWTGRSALGVLSLSFLGSAAQAQKNAGTMERFSIGARPESPREFQVRDTISGTGQLRINARSGMLDWGTGGFGLRGERLRWGRRSIDTVRLEGQWRRTYAADMRFWRNAAPDIVLEVGARLERTNSGMAGGSLLTSSTKSIAQMAYVGAQISDSSSIRLLGFDNGGWSANATRELVSRIVNGGPAARKGAAIEIGRFEFRPGDARWEPQFKLRVERGRTAARADTSATISCKVRL